MAATTKAPLARTSPGSVKAEARQRRREDARKADQPEVVQAGRQYLDALDIYIESHGTDHDFGADAKIIREVVSTYNAFLDQFSL